MEPQFEHRVMTDRIIKRLLGFVAVLLSAAASLAADAQPTIPPSSSQPAPGLRVVQQDAPSDTKATGVVIIETDPVQCTIDIPALGLIKQKKDKTQYRLEGVPEGHYEATVTSDAGTTAVTHIFVRAGETVRVTVNIPIFIGTPPSRPSSPGAGSAIGSSFYLQSPRLRMIWIRSGAFNMGGGGGNPDELPLTHVTISEGFWLGETEVTQAQWQSVMQSNPSDFRGDNLPVERISWADAMDFCRMLTAQERAAGRLPVGYEYTLPTEAQWEYACRAGSSSQLAGSAYSLAWLKENAGQRTNLVATRAPNAWGLYDMLGNVWEWCADAKRRYPGGGVSDPLNLSGATMIYRGGSWYDSDSIARVAYRNSGSAAFRWHTIGFRVALSKVH